MEQLNTSAEPFYDLNGACATTYDEQNRQRISETADRAQKELQDAQFVKLARIGKSMGNILGLFDIIRECHRSAFLVNVDNLGGSTGYLERTLGTNSKRIGYTKSKVPIFSVATTALLGEGTNFKAKAGQSFIKKLLESGLYKFWKKIGMNIQLRRQFTDRNYSDMLQAQKLSSNIGTIFVGCLILWGLAILQLFIEIVSSVMKRIQDRIQNVGSAKKI